MEVNRARFSLEFVQVENIDDFHVIMKKKKTSVRVPNSRLYSIEHNDPLMMIIIMLMKNLPMIDIHSMSMIGQGRSRELIGMNC